MRSVNVRPGDQVGQLTVLRRGRRTKDGVQLFVVSCDCRTTFVLARRDVIKKEVTACRTCQNVETMITLRRVAEVVKKHRKVERGFWTGL